MTLSVALHISVISLGKFMASGCIVRVAILLPTTVAMLCISTTSASSILRSARTTWRTMSCPPLRTRCASSIRALVLAAGCSVLHDRNHRTCTCVLCCTSVHQRAAAAKQSPNMYRNATVLFRVCSPTTMLWTMPGFLMLARHLSVLWTSSVKSMAMSRSRSRCQTMLRLTHRMMWQTLPQQTTFQKLQPW